MLRSKATVAHLQVAQPTDLLAPCETMTATTATAMTATTASLPSRSEHLPASMTQAMETVTLQPEVPDVQPQAPADTAPTAPVFRQARVGSGSAAGTAAADTKPSTARELYRHSRSLSLRSAADGKNKGLSNRRDLKCALGCCHPFQQRSYQPRGQRPPPGYHLRRLRPHRSKQEPQ